MRDSCASATAGIRLAAAVPEVQVIATGRPVDFAMPRATKPADRSSITECERIRSSAASVRAIGALRDPGQVTACSIPQRASSSTSAWIGAKVRLIGIMAP